MGNKIKNKNYNVVLFGGSNSVLKNGLQQGLKQDNVNLFNFSLGMTTCIQNLYELKRSKNFDCILKADLIISESNINDYAAVVNPKESLSLEILYRNLDLFYYELSIMKDKKILILILPMFKHISEIVNKIHLKLIFQYKLNYIDMSYFFNKYDFKDFYQSYDMQHPLPVIMENLGQNIIHNIELLHITSHIQIEREYSLNIYEMSDKTNSIQNSMYSENPFVLSNNKMYFPKKFYGYKFLSLHTWNYLPDIGLKNSTLCYSDILIQNKEKYILKSCNFLNSCVEIQDSDFVIDKNTYFLCENKRTDYTEYYHGAKNWLSNSKKYNSLNLISFFLIKYDKNM
ncbi:hypothetical protein, partial [Campylobacter volucris]|uniref:hypothetical protein n=1 Tax=Campylobacter volucris TaxID=1031542 RepID=UPI00189DB166